METKGEKDTVEAFGRIAEIFVTVILLFLVPLNYMAQKQDLICQNYVTQETAYLVDSVRNLGYLDQGMYETYLKKLGETNHVYEVSLTHYSKRADLEDPAEGDNYRYHYYGIYTEDIVNTLYGEGEALEEQENAPLYTFRQGDFFSVRVENRDKTLAAKLEEAFLGRRLEGAQILAAYGGGIRDEAY